MSNSSKFSPTKNPEIFSFDLAKVFSKHGIHFICYGVPKLSTKIQLRENFDLTPHHIAFKIIVTYFIKNDIKIEYP